MFNHETKIRIFSIFAELKLHLDVETASALPVFFVISKKKLYLCRVGSFDLDD